MSDLLRIPYMSDFQHVWYVIVLNQAYLKIQSIKGAAHWWYIDEWT